MAATEGHFTTMQLRGGAVQGFDLHLTRLREANRILFDADLDEEALRSAIRERVAAGAGDCTLRISIRRDGEPGIDIEPSREVSHRPLRLCSQRGVRSLAAFKHLDLAHQLRARQAAIDAGFDDALLVDGEDRVAEGTFWNLVLWDGVAMIWPEAPMLDGITQRLLQRALSEAGVPQRHAVVRLDDLPAMRAAFALNSRGVQEVGAVDGCTFSGDAAMSSRLRALLAGMPWQRP